MLKECTVYICDFCGKAELARPILYRYNETTDELPYGWTTGRTDSVHFCPACSKKLSS